MHLIPGLGGIDFSSVRRALEDVGYTGPLTLELYPYQDRPGEAGSEGLQYLRRLFR